MKGRKEPYKKCTKCNKDKKLSNFYNSNSKITDGKSPICKDCIKEMIDYEDMNSVYSILRTLDIPFILEYWNKALEKSDKDPFGNYMRMANSLRQFQGLTWDDSIFESKDELINIKDSENKTQIVSNKELIEKWGDYPLEEIKLFEKKYQELRVNYPERTAMHTEALKIYVRYRVKEELATQKGAYKEAEAWGKLAKDAATSAKINPSQLSKADLSDGFDTFSQLVRTVEQAVDIIPILPKFKARPQDRADFTLWCYINYVRDLKGLPPAKYEDIYKFYEERKKEYEQMMAGEGQDGEL